MQVSVYRVIGRSKGTTIAVKDQYKGCNIRLKKGLKLNFKDGEKVKVSPVGEVIGLDGRGFVVDGDAIVSAVMANGLDIVLDANHNFDKALGWFGHESFEVREDGVYATLELTPLGMEANTNKSYRYLSPVYVMANDRVVAELDSVGFVNRPNLLNNALNHKEQENMTMEELKTQQDALAQSLADFSATAHENLKAMGESITAFEANDKVRKEELDALKVELNGVNEKLNIFGKSAELDENKHGQDLSEGEKAAAARLGLSEEQYKNAREGK